MMKAASCVGMMVVAIELENRRKQGKRKAGKLDSVVVFDWALGASSWGN